MIKIILEGKIKCRKYNACKDSCLECDLLSNKKCDLEFSPEIPKRFLQIDRSDCNLSWNECTSCGCSIGYRQDIKDFKCKRCGQRILWE